jgi:F420-0:gamma-glutamyl ligase
MSKKDFFVKPLLITKHTTADNLVAAAQGKAVRARPAVLIRDAPAVFFDRGADIPQMSGEKCLYFV